MTGQNGPELGPRTVEIDRKRQLRAKRRRIARQCGGGLAFLAVLVTLVTGWEQTVCYSAGIVGQRSALEMYGLSQIDQDELVKEIVRHSIAKKVAEGEPLSDAEIARIQIEIEAAIRKFASNTTGPEETALRLLAEGKFDEGLALLEHLATRASSELAEKWRRIGELARPLNTAKALSAYEKVVALDASEPWDSIHLGRLYVRAGNLPAARATFEAALARLPEGEERTRGVLAAELGQVDIALGDLASAAKNFATSAAIMQARADAEPDDTERQHDLSVSHEKIGDVLRDQGDLAGARAAYRAGLAIREKLAADDPSHAGWQRDLIVSYAKLGGMEPGVGWWAKALAVADAMAAKGTLAPVDAWMLEDLKRRAAEDTE